MATTFALADAIALRDSLELVNPGTAFALKVDIFNFVDTVSAPTLGFGLLLSDTLALSDAVTDTIKFGLPFPLPDATPDRILLIDSVEIALNAGQISVLVFDLFNFRDSRSTSNTNGPQLTDAIALSDLLGIGPSFTASPDSLNLTDAAAYTLSSIFVNLTITASDALALSDSIQISVPGKLNKLADTLLLSDQVFIAIGSNFIPYLRRYLNDVRE